jgi:putative hydrolase of the HAD superfamily
MVSASQENPLLRSRPVRWENVRTVLLDMDGTLLDLRFDNYFWLELVPERFAAHHALELGAAREALVARFAKKQGSLDWYCTDYWSRELQLDIAALKREVRAQVRFVAGAERFLAQLRAQGLRLVLVTNAHHDALTIKHEQTGLIGLVDAAFTSHDYGVPKEHPEFWLKLQADIDFDPADTLFVDDSLPVLRAARNHGIAQLVAIAQPDSTQTARDITEFPSVPTIAALL